MSSPIFKRENDEFIPTDNALGPWGKTLHGGSVSGLFAQLLWEEHGEDECLIARFDVELFTPVPQKPLRVETKIIKQGRRLLLKEQHLLQGERLLARALVTIVAALPGNYEKPLQHFAAPVAGPMEYNPWSFSSGGELFVQKGFHTQLELRHISGCNLGGTGAAWIRLPLTVFPETPISPWVAMVSIADACNGLAQYAPAPRTGTINADLKIQTTRYPESEWLYFSAEAGMNEIGVGGLHGVIHDEKGLVATLSQTILINPIA